MKFSQKHFENWRIWKSQFFWVGHFEKKKSFILMKISQSLFVSKDGSKFLSSQTWQHFLTRAKNFDGEHIGIWIFLLKIFGLIVCR